MEYLYAEMKGRTVAIPWTDVAKQEIAELQATVTAQTAEINRLIDRLDHLERIVQKYINGDEHD